MSALRLIPWVLHQGFVYVAGVMLVVAPFLLGTAEGGPLAVFIGAGVVLLAAGVLGKPPAGVVGLVPVAAHAGLVYLLGFFLVLAPFLFGFSDDPNPMATAVFSGLALIVVSLLTAFPRGGDTAETPETDLE